MHVIKLRWISHIWELEKSSTEDWFASPQMEFLTMLSSFVLFVSSFGFTSREKPHSGSVQRGYLLIQRFIFIYLLIEKSYHSKNTQKCHTSREKPHSGSAQRGHLLIQ